MGKHIGLTYTGCPMCADDVLLMSTSPEELQSMLDLACTYSPGAPLFHPPTEELSDSHGYKQCVAEKGGNL